MPIYFHAVTTSDNRNEVEVKVRVADLGALAAKLQESGFQLRTPRTHEMNTLYDFADLRLRSRGELLRIRKYGERWTVTYKAKGKEGRHKSRREIETAVDDGEQLAAIFTSLGFSVVFRYEKFRTEWSDGRGHLVLDETPIGNLAEIEGGPEWIDATAQRLGLSERDYITDSYAALFWKWRDETGSSAKEMTFEALSLKP
jgi:adenylate cyclase, class 2